jgi:hypothetical protein
LFTTSAWLCSCGSPGPAGAVIEDRRRQPGRPNLLGAVRAAAREGGVRVQIPERRLQRGPVRGLHLPPHPVVAQRPQGADALRHRKGQVVPGHPVHPPRPPQRMPGLRVQRPPEQRLQLPLLDQPPRCQLERGQPAAVPATRCLTGAEVVVAGAAGHLVLVVPPARDADLRRTQHDRKPGPESPAMRRTVAFSECTCLRLVITGGIAVCDWWMWRVVRVSGGVVRSLAVWRVGG